MAGKQNKPDQVLPNSPRSTPSPMPPIIQDPSLKGISFDQLLENRGVRFIHRRAAPCPNIQSLDDNSHNPLCPICDGNGMMYYCDTEIRGAFQSNSLQKNFEQQGMWEIGTAVVSLPAEYDDGSQAEFQTYDQLVIPDFTVRQWELKEYEPRTGNIQRLRYPIVNTDFVGVAENDVLRELIEGTDFNITVDGNIEWLTTLAYDNINDRGEVFVINYFANPVYTVLQHMRELRITQEQNSGIKTARRLPQQILVKRDFLANPPETEG